MNNNRYPRIYFLKRQTISKNALNNSSDKYNWYWEVKRVFIDQINEADTCININLEMLRMNKEEYIQKYKEYLAEIESEVESRKTQRLKALLLL